jgi:hypothetical protein
MSFLRLTLATLLAALLAPALSAPLPAAEVKVVLQQRQAWSFPEDGVTFDNQFPGARVNELHRVGPREYRVVIRPENQPINGSPWYAFRVTASNRVALTIRLTYPYSNHRYHPKTSRDGKVWEALPASACRTEGARKEAVLTLDVPAGTLWVAAQELIRSEEMHAWMDTQARLPFASGRLFGKSIAGRPLRLLEFTEGAPPNYVFIIGRQHPPEVTGTLGLMAFVETINGGTALARDYRKKFRTVVLPLLNPDGVEEGQWRSNLGALDTNRDWNKFTQPETAAARDTLLEIAKRPGARVYLFLDFHSTARDIFYTQPERAETFPPRFTQDWLAAIKRRFPDYEVSENGAHQPGSNVSKGWAYDQFGAPAITYELGDNTPRPLIRQIVSGAAEEMMKLLLAAEAKETAGRR